MRKYALQARDGDERSRLIAENVEVARRIALRVARRVPEWLSSDDLVAAAMVGLAEAADRYDADRGEPFVAFAEKRIRGAVLDELRRGDIMPRRARAAARKVGESIRKLEHELGRAPEDAEVARALGVTVAEYQEELSLLTHVSVVELAGEEGDDGQAYPDELLPSQQVERAELVRRVRAGLERLGERDALLLSLYYNEEFTYAEIGNLLGVSESRVCQLHARAIARLRVEIE
jgi:RNA polymerase sigma factor for flagellar operon FliA